MKFDREGALKKAEKLLHQGRLDGAIAEYVKVVDAFPNDFTAANTLGDLYVRAGQTERAAAQYTHIADHFADEGFLPKASALYKKVLKIRPNDEAVQLRLADVSARQGLLADAKATLTAVAQRRRARGDTEGANEILMRLGSLDATDLEARVQAARIAAQSGDTAGAAKRFRDLAADLAEKGRADEALEMLREVVRWDPDDRDTRARLARAALAAGDRDQAKTFLSREVAGDDPALLEALAEAEVQAGRVDDGLVIIQALLDSGAAVLPKVIELAWTLCEQDPEAAFRCAEVAADRSVTAGEFAEAAAILQEFVTRVPRHIAALLKLVELCVDGGLEAAMYAAQVQLAEAYLAGGQALAASVIAEDLVAREPWEPTHIDRFRRALTMLKTPNPDAVIAERLSGYSPFTATDPFVQVADTSDQPASAIDTGTAAPRPAAPPAFHGSPGGVNLGAVLREADRSARRAAEPDAVVDLSDVLPGLRRKPEQPSAPHPAPSLDQGRPRSWGEAAHDVREAHGEQYVALARTYRDMGMIDEAMRALETAVRSPRHRFEAASMLASIYKQRGQPVQAVEWMEQAVEAPAPTAAEGRALLYALGETLESLGEVARALAVFLELQADVGDYRDVKARVDRLSRAQTGG